MSYLDYVDKFQDSRAFFERTMACLREEDGTFQPQAEAFSTIEQIAHAAQTVDWFLKGVETGQFSTDFAAHREELGQIRNLQGAKSWFERSMAEAIAAVQEKPATFWKKPLPEGPMFSGYPRAFALDAILDHNAHHRGALAVYARLCGHVPAMPYGDGA
ncbi:MAG: DinB family protein [Planctomycetes bacterium]|nr:DinB family protein [Planctomycetota bacterium]HPF13029.1 DinB family protein [Planctomycetota bacterium]